MVFVHRHFLFFTAVCAITGTISTSDICSIDSDLLEKSVRCAVGANITLKTKFYCTNHSTLDVKCRIKITWNKDVLEYLVMTEDCSNYWASDPTGETFVSIHKTNLTLDWKCFANNNSGEVQFKSFQQLSPTSTSLLIEDSSINLPVMILNNITVHISYCQKNVSGRRIVSKSGNYTYGDSGEFECGKEEMLISLNSKNLLRDKDTVCGPFATWSDIDDVACWRAPSVILNQSALGWSYRAGDKLLANICHLEDPGIPANRTVLFHWNDIFERLPLTLKPEHNNKTMFCQVDNELTALTSINFNRGRSETFTLDIRFGPFYPTHKADCVPSDASTFNVSLHLAFYANPRCVDLTFIDAVSHFNSKGIVQGANDCCNVSRQWFNFTVLNVGINELVSINCTMSNTTQDYQNLNLTVYKNLNLTASCFSTQQPTPGTKQFYSPPQSRPEDVSQLSPSGNDGDFQTTSSLPVTTIAGIAGGVAVLLILCIILLVCLIVRRRRKSESHSSAQQNPAFSESSSAGHQGGSERQECANILYGTADDLKSGDSSIEVVDNVLYGTTTGPQISDDVYTTVNKTNKKKKDGSGADQAAELYSSVQKPEKTKAKAKGVDPGASTSGLQSDDTYAEVNKDRKKKKDGKKTGRQENSGFTGDAQQDATYAVVDKKKNKGAKGKKADEPGTSGLVEEATYAVVNKKDKKPKKDGPDDDLHGSNKS